MNSCPDHPPIEEFVDSPLQPVLAPCVTLADILDLMHYCIYSVTETNTHCTMPLSVCRKSVGGARGCHLPLPLTFHQELKIKIALETYP